MKKKKVFANTWLIEPLELLPSFDTRRMFGGLAIYVHGLMVLVLMEQEDDPDWNGVLLPTCREYHADLLGRFAELKPHPILGKWLYLSQASIDFETSAQQIVEAIVGHDPKLGIVPGTRKRRAPPK